MSNEYDAAVAAEMGLTAPAGAVEPTTPAASVVPDAARAVPSQIDDVRAQNARVGMFSALAQGVDPNRYAEAADAARRMGVPVQTVLALPDEIKRQQAMQSVDFDALATNSPATADALANPATAAIAHDNVPSMTGFEELLRGTGGFVAGTAKALASAAPKFNEGVWGLARAGAENLLPTAVGQPLAGYFASLGGGQRSMADSLMPKSDNLLGASWYSGMQSMGLNLLQLPLLLAAPETAPAMLGGQAAKLSPVLVSMGLTTGGQAYGEARDKGVGALPALAFGASQGAIEAGTEMLGMPALLRTLQPGRFAAKAAEYMVKEQGGEQIATALQDLNEWAVLPENKGKTFADYLSARPAAAAQTALSTLFAGGGQVAVMKGIGLMAQRDEKKVSDAGSTAQLLGKLNTLAAADKVLQRDPATFESFITSAAENGPVQQVFINATDLQQAGLADQLAAVSPSVAQ
ncbi:MAG TPA: hypothetical protein VGC24_01015, partial [Burkholderiaceae bacterium]